MIIKSYSHKDTQILKGFAIICICLHNFFHHLAPSPGENEFYFSINHINNFFSQLSENPADFINTLFSYLGHYGVQIFIFISGYGLTISMMNNPKPWLSFVIDRLKKLYPLLLTAFLFFILYTIIMYEKFPWTDCYKDMKYKLLFIHTLLPKQGISVNGPWWFFGLIFQLYLVFPALFVILKKYNVKALITICIISFISIFISQYYFQDMDVYLLQNFPGHLPEFCLGIYIAMNRDVKINNLIFIVALIVFCLGNFYKIFFPFTFLSVTIVSVFAYQACKNIPIKKTILKQFLIHFGNISMSLFAVHGFLRAPFLTLTYKSLDTPLGHLYAAFLFFISAYLLSFAAMQMYDMMLSIFNKIRLPKEEKRTVRIVSRTLQIALLIFASYTLYYFISQRVSTDVDQIAGKEQISDSYIVKNNSEFNTFANVNIDKRYKTIRIEGSMDLKNLKPNAKIPLLIIEINGVLWDKIQVKGDYHDFEEFKFSYVYHVPIIKSTKNKDLKIYFWNTQKAELELKNINVSIEGSR